MTFDAIISVGYHVKSERGTVSRIWAPHIYYFDDKKACCLANDLNLRGWINLI